MRFSFLGPSVVHVPDPTALDLLQRGKLLMMDLQAENARLKGEVERLEALSRNLERLQTAKPDPAATGGAESNELSCIKAENEALRRALGEIAVPKVPRAVGHTYRSDGQPSDDDKCWHGITMRDVCAPCLIVHARNTLEDSSNA